MTASAAAAVAVVATKILWEYCVTVIMSEMHDFKLFSKGNYAFLKSHCDFATENVKSHSILALAFH